MKYTRLYMGDDGQSHFEECAMTLLDAAIGQVAQSEDVGSALFGFVDDTREVSWHNPPCRQYIIMLKGVMEIEIGNGEIKRFKEGEILLAEDVTGQGHITRAASEGPRHYLALPIS